jgi:Ca-activated chloride channel homolog
VNEYVFGAPHFLWLLAAPAVLLLAWLWRFGRRWSDLRRLRVRRALPIRERYALGGDLWPWLFLTLALAALVVAAARPRGVTTQISRAGLDIVVLQDGSASMHVQDTSATRWQRSMTFLRVLGDSLSWNDDRMALTVFAHIATPQIRLTSDPNTVLFFLDHLHGRPPFRLQDDTTWDTNLEQGIAWGLRLLEKDRELHGASPNGKLFVLLSDGESWSGEVARSIARASREHVPLNVIGVGTLGGGALPESTSADGTVEPSPGRSRLDRASLQRIAAAGGGQYYELGRDADRDIANAIIDAGRRQAPTTIEAGSVEELYWRFLASAIVLAALASLFLRERAELWMQLAASAATAIVVLRLIAA